MDRIRKDNQFRLEQRKQELDRIEQELALKRSERKLVRQREREQHDATQTLISQITVKAAENSLLNSEIQSAQSEFLNKSIELKQRDRHAKIQSERESFNMRAQRLNKLREKLYEKRKPPANVTKKFMKQPTEFYGIDFSTPTAEQLDKRAEELFEVTKHRENMLLQDSNSLDTFLKGGDMFIKALMDLRINDDASNALIDRKLEMMKLKEPLFDVPSPMVENKKLKQDKLIQSKKWTDLLPKDEVDYSEMFPPGIGMTVGLTVFRIEEMKPVQQTLKVGKISFCDGDCYLVLKTFTRDETDGLLDWQIYQFIGVNSSIDKKTCSAIFAVGLRNLLGSSRQVIRIQSNDSEAKELFAEFYAFGIDVERSDQSHATESGLFSVEAREFPLLVYRFVNSQGSTVHFDLDLSDPKRPVFDSSSVYLIDKGRSVYVWNGKDSPLADRMKCRLLAQKILKSERATLKNTHLKVIDDGAETDDFLNCFPDDEETSDESHVAFNNVLYRNLYVFDESYVGKNIGFPQDYLKYSRKETENWKLPKFEMLKTDGCCVLDCGSEIYLWTGKKSSFELKQFTEAFLTSKIFPLIERPRFTQISKVMQNVEPEVFKIRFERWPAVNNFKPPKHLLTVKKPSDKTSNNSDITALFSPPPTGKFDRSDMEFCEELFKRANSLLQSFQAFIYQPEERNFIRLPGFAFSEQNQELEYHENGHLWTSEFYVFVCLYKKQTEKQPDDFHGSRSLAESYSSVNALAASAHNLSRSAYLASSRNDMRHYQSNHSLPKPLTAPAPTMSIDSSESSLDLKSERKGYECVVYTWSSSETSSFGKLTYEFEFKQTIQDMVAEMSQGLVHVNTVHLTHEKESVAFLAHLNNQVVVHRGRRMFENLRPKIPFRYPDIYNLEKTTSDQLNCIRMFHIRTDPKLKTCKAIEVPAYVKSLCTRDCFVVINIDDSSSNANFLWVGKGVSMEESSNAENIAQKLFDYYHLNRGSTDSSLDNISGGTSQRIRERNEPLEFWQMLGPTFDRPESMMGLINVGQGFYHALPPPRLFCCSTQTGKFHVTDLRNNFTISDMHDQNVYILDTAPTKGKPYMIWVWAGTKAQDLIIELSKKSLQAYLVHTNDGRFFEDSDWITGIEDKCNSLETVKTRKPNQLSDITFIKQGFEPSEFKAFFHGWGDLN